MELMDILVRQYAASLEMIGTASAECPESLWLDQAAKFPFWRIAYHALFFTHLYASASLEEYTPWSGYREGLESFDTDAASAGGPFPANDIAKYCDHIKKTIRKDVPLHDLEGPSGIPWWKEFSKLEMHIYNLRHLQHHTGQLVDRLRNSEDIEIDWVGKA